jgi:predicted transcriptional regulator
MRLMDILVKNPPMLNKNRPITDTLEILRKESVDSVCICDEKPIGTISYRDILSKIGLERVRRIVPEALYNSSFVRYFPTYVSDECSIRKCAELMIEFNTNSLPFFYGDTFLGMIYRRDMIRFIEDSSITIESLMNRNPLVIYPYSRIIHVRRMMLDNNLSFLPVLSDNGKVLGAVTEGEVVDTLIEFYRRTPEKHQKARIREILVTTSMVVDVPIVEKETILSDIAVELRKKGLIGAIVTENQKIIGILTYNEILKYIVHSFPEGL